MTLWFLYNIGYSGPRCDAYTVPPPEKLQQHCSGATRSDIFHQLVKKSSKTPFCGNFSQCGPCLTLIGRVWNRRNIMRPYFSSKSCQLLHCMKQNAKQLCYCTSALLQIRLEKISCHGNNTCSHNWDIYFCIFQTLYYYLALYLHM